MRLLESGTPISRIARRIQEAAAAFQCHPIRGTVSARISRFVLNSGVEIINAPEDEDEDSHIIMQNDTDEENIMAADVLKIEHGEAYVVNILMSTGSGRAKELDAKPTIYQRNVNTSYALKLKASRGFLNECEQKFGVFPFSLR